MAKAKGKPAADLSHDALLRARQAYPRLGVPMEDLGFRRLSQEADRDLPPLTQDRMIEIAAYLAQINPLGHWLIETNKDFIVGEGIRLEADDAETDTELQDVLDEFWYDPINNWPEWQEDIARELGIFGEQVWPAFVDRATGRVRLACVDPALISKVLIDPDNARVPIGVAIKKSLKSTKERLLRIIYDDDDAVLFTKRTQRVRAEMTDGECFYSTVNKLSTASRGVSDLLHLFDWLDGYDQFLFDMLERASLLSAFVWDVTLKNADDTAIKKWLSENGPPRRGSVRAHNEGVEWNAVSPDIKSYESDEMARLLRNQILGGAGIPEHWYGGGGDVNRAVGAEMGEPTYKRLASRQRRIKGMIERVADYQITQAVITGRRLKGVADPYAYSVVVPEMISKDLTKIGSVIASLASALSLAKTDGLIDEATAQRIFATPVGQLGVEINLGDMAAKIAEEQERRESKDYMDNPGGANPPVPPFDKGGAGGISQTRRVPSRYRTVQLARRRQRA